jgi:hypothetical protein
MQQSCHFTPADDLEGAAISALMWDDGIRAVIPLWRDDLGNAGLEAATRKHFTGQGGAALDGVRYGTSTQDFAATVSALRSKVDQAIARYGSNRVGV